MHPLPAPPPLLPAPPPAPASARRPYWLVQMNYRNRSIFYGLLCLAITARFRDTGASATLWVLMGLQFLVYPHLAYLFARHAADQRRAEMRNQLADGLLAGAWAAALGLPLWIVFTMFAGTCLHMVTFYGYAGLPRVFAAMGTGAALVWASGRAAPMQLQTDLATTLLSMLALTLFFVAFAHDGYRRAMRQHRAEQTLRAQVSEISALQAQLQDQAVRDPLTGLHNRRHLAEVLPAALARCRADGTSLAVVLIDLDHFKQINDRHGHAAGDAVLQVLARLMQARIRPQDMACRYGGEEFLLVMGGATLEVAQQRADALRRSFQQGGIRFGDLHLVATLSCGVAAFPGHGHDADTLLRAADAALYRAKAAGRNQVASAFGEGASGPGEPPAARPG